MEDCWSHWGGLSLKWIVLFLQILSLKKNKKNIHRLGLSKASSESVNFVPTIEFHYTRQRRYTRVVQFHYTTMFFFFHVALSNNAQTIKTVLYFFWEKEKLVTTSFERRHNVRNQIFPIFTSLLNSSHCLRWHLLFISEDTCILDQNIFLWTVPWVHIHLAFLVLFWKHFLRINDLVTKDLLSNVFLSEMFRSAICPLYL